jgi:hypothetical protein
MRLLQKVFAGLAILSGALSLRLEDWARSVGLVERTGELTIAFTVGYATLLIATIGLALSVMLGWLKERSSNPDKKNFKPKMWVVFVFIFGISSLIIARPTPSADIKVQLPPQKAN